MWPARSVEEAGANLKEAVELFLEEASPEEIQERLHSEVYISRFNASVGHVSHE